MDEEKKDKIGGTLVPQKREPDSGTFVMHVEPATIAVQGSDIDLFLTVSSVAPPNEQAAIMTVQPILRKLPEPVLYVYAHDDQPVGPRLGVRNVPETTLKALTVHEWKQQDQERELRAAEAKAARDRRWDIAKIIVAALIGLLVGWLAKSPPW